jgi:ABC-type hemin transport system ATPase subunit
VSDDEEDENEDDSEEDEEDFSDEEQELTEDQKSALKEAEENIDRLVQQEKKIEEFSKQEQQRKAFENAMRQQLEFVRKLEMDEQLATRDLIQRAKYFSDLTKDVIMALRLMHDDPLNNTHYEIDYYNELKNGKRIISYTIQNMTGQ